MNAPTQRPRCYLVYAHAPIGMHPAEANRQFNAFIADPERPLVLFHDHFIGQPGGLAIFFLEHPDQYDALTHDMLPGWQTEVRPLIFSRNPAALDEQIRYTLQRYRGEEWNILRHELRPSYGNPRREVETAAEDTLA